MSKKGIRTIEESISSKSFELLDAKIQNHLTGGHTRPLTGMYSGAGI